MTFVDVVPPRAEGVAEQEPSNDAAVRVTSVVVVVAMKIASLPESMVMISPATSSAPRTNVTVMVPWFAPVDRMVAEGTADVHVIAAAAV
jgi:hypothetical protein